MSLTQCPQCGADIPILYCPSCGERLNTQKKITWWKGKNPSKECYLYHLEGGA